MSFDFSTLPTKEHFIINNPPAPAPVARPKEELYAAHKAQVQNRITSFFSRSGNGSSTQLCIRVGFLTSDDLAALQASLVAKGYTCSVQNNLLTIQ